MTQDLLTSDRKLLDAFRRGDREALLAVWEHYLPLVRKLAHGGVGGYRGFASPADVDDAVSATFCAAFQESARTHYDGTTPYAGYLVGIARNVMRRIHKKQARMPVEDADDYPEAGCTEATPEDLLVTCEQTEVLARFTRLLQPDELEVFDGYYKQGLSEERLAESLGRTRHRIRKTLAAVERRLRRYLKDMGLDHA